MAEPSEHTDRLVGASSPEGCGMDLSRTEAPKTRVCFTAHRSGAFPVLRLRTVARGEWTSAWIVNRTRRGPFLTLCEVCEYE